MRREKKRTGPAMDIPPEEDADVAQGEEMMGAAEMHEDGTL